MLTSPVATLTATVNIVTETGKPLSQLTVIGKLGANVRTQIQQSLTVCVKLATLF